MFFVFQWKIGISSFWKLWTKLVSQLCKYVNLVIFIKFY